MDKTYIFLAKKGFFPVPKVDKTYFFLDEKKQKGKKKQRQKNPPWIKLPTLVGTLVGGVGDLDLTFDLAIVTLTYKFLSKLYLGNHKVWDVVTW